MSRDDEPAGLTPIRVEVLYFTGCPNHDGLADRIQQLLTDRQLPARVVVVRVDTDNDAHRLAFLGSPTIRSTAPTSSRRRPAATATDYSAASS